MLAQPTNKYLKYLVSAAIVLTLGGGTGRARGLRKNYDQHHRPGRRRGRRRSVHR